MKYLIKTNDEIRAELIGKAEAELQKFAASLTPGDQEILGVRVPIVKLMAKQIAANEYAEYLAAPYTLYHEECLLYGLVIGYIKTDINQVIEYFDKWLECVKNWAVCDSSVANVKAFGKPQNSEVVWKYLTDKLASTDKPYIKRAIVVAMFCYFVNDDYCNKVADMYCDIKDEHYYIKMAISWGISVIAVKYYPIAVKMLSLGKLDKWVQNKAIQKCCESFRITPLQKEELRALKV